MAGNARQTDDDAYADDEALSSATLTSIADMGLYAQSNATRGAVAAYNTAEDLAYLHSIPGGTDGADDGRDPARDLGWRAYLWVPAQRANSLTVQLYCQGYVGDTTIGLHVQTLDQWLRDRRISERIDSDTASTGGTLITLTTGAIYLQYGVPYVVCISAQSTFGSAIEGWYDDNTGTPDCALEGWSRIAAYGDDQAGSTPTYWGTSSPVYTAFANDRTPYLIEWVNGSDPFTAVYDTKGAVTTGQEYPTGRLLRRTRAADQAHLPTTYDTCYVWPPLERQLNFSQAIDQTQDWVRRTPISYVELESVEIYEGVEAMASFGALVAPESVTSYAAGRTVGRYAAQVAGQHTRVYCIDPPAVASSSLRQGSAVALTTAYQTLGEVVVGDASRYDIGGTDYAHASYRLIAVVYVLAIDPVRNLSDSLDVRFTAKTLSGGSLSNPVTRVYQHDVNTVSGGVGSVVEDLAGHWLLDYTRSWPVSNSTLGMWCNTAFSTARPLVIDVNVPDTFDPGAIGRKIEIEVKRPSRVSYRTRFAYCLLDNIYVGAVPGLRAENGEEI